MCSSVSIRSHGGRVISVRFSEWTDETRADCRCAGVCAECFRNAIYIHQAILFRPVIVAGLFPSPICRDVGVFSLGDFSMWACHVLLFQFLSDLFQNTKCVLMSCILQL